MYSKTIVSFICSAVERIFAKTGNSLNVVKDDGFTTLHIAAINDHREIAKILLKKVILFLKKSFTAFSFFFFFFFLRARLPLWLNCFNRIERESYVFNLGTEYDFLCVVSLNIQHYFYVYSPIVKK